MSMKITTKLWIGLGILIALSPLGLILPEYFKAGSAWDKQLSNIWHAPITNYSFRGWEGEKRLPHLSFAYIISAVIGVAVIVILALLIGKTLSKKGD